MSLLDEEHSMLKKLSHSLSFRLLAIFFLLSIIFVYGTILATRWVFSTDQLRELVSGHLSLHIDYVKRDIGNPPNLDNALSLTEKIPVDIKIVGPDILWSSVPNFPNPEEMSFGGIDNVSYDARPWLYELDDIEFAATKTHKFLKIRQDDFSIIVSSPKIANQSYSRQLIPAILTLGILTILGCYLAVRWLFKPIDNIRRGAERIGSGNLAHRIKNVRNDELGDLTEDINHMAEDVERILDAKRQLLLGISHELRSPISRMNLALELIKDDESTAMLKQDVLEMESIISTLLEAEHMHERHAALRISRISATDLMQSLIKDYFSKDSSKIEAHIPEGLLLTADEARVVLMLKNLISNALRYIDPKSGKIDVRFTVTDNSWLINVQDNGIGFPENKIEHIGEPFFRADASRTRDTGVSGLGLYLTKSIAEAHGGKLSLDREWKNGAAFIIEIPFEPEGGRYH